ALSRANRREAAHLRARPDFLGCDRRGGARGRPAGRSSFGTPTDGRAAGGAGGATRTETCRACVGGAKAAERKRSGRAHLFLATTKPLWWAGGLRYAPPA